MTIDALNKTLDKKLRSAGRRCSGSIFLSRLAVTLWLAGGLAVVAALVHRLLGVAAFTAVTVGAVLLAAVMAGVVGWWLARPGRTAVAVLVDERLGLKERVSTALAFSDSDDAFAQAAAGQARAAAERLDVSPHFPVQPGGRRWAFAAVTWCLAAALFQFVPPLDALGFLKRQTDIEQAKLETAQAQADVKDVVKPLEAVVKEIGDPAMLQQLEQLMEIPPAASADEIRRQAIQKLEDVSQKAKELQERGDLAAAKALQEKLQQLRSPPGSESQELNRALQNGDFRKASQIVAELQKKFDEGKLDPQQKEALTSQLEQLAQQLDKLAQDNSELADELARKGLDKNLAGQSLEDLREALKNAGLSDKEIDDLMKKAQQCQSSNQACKSLGDSMKLPGLPSPIGLRSENLQSMQEQLSDLEMAQQRLQQAQAAKEQADNAIAKLGQCGGNNGDGGSGNNPGQGGDGDGAGEGQGGQSGGGAGRGQQGSGMGEGLGSGERPTADPTNVSLNQTRVDNQENSQAPIIGNWHIQGDQVKGEATQTVGEVIQAKREQAAQAVNDNDIPKKYDASIQKYYNEFAKPESK